MIDAFIQNCRFDIISVNFYQHFVSRYIRTFNVLILNNNRHMSSNYMYMRHNTST